MLDLTNIVLFHSAFILSVLNLRGVEYCRVFKLVLLAIIDYFVKNRGIEYQIVWQWLLADWPKNMLNILLVLLLAPQFLLNLVPRKFDSVQVSFVGISNAKQLCLIVNCLRVFHLEAFLCKMVGWPCGRSWMLSVRLGLRTYHLVVKKELLSL